MYRGISKRLCLALAAQGPLNGTCNSVFVLLALVLEGQGLPNWQYCLLLHAPNAVTHTTDQCTKEVVGSTACTRRSWCAIRMLACCQESMCWSGSKNQLRYCGQHQSHNTAAAGKWGRAACRCTASTLPACHAAQQWSHLECVLSREANKLAQQHARISFCVLHASTAWLTACVTGNTVGRTWWPEPATNDVCYKAGTTVSTHPGSTCPVWQY